MGEKTENLLLLYLLQCRAKDFIKSFEAQSNRCFTGVYSLYRLAYSNYLLLSDDDWNPSCISVIEQCRKGCREILEYLQTIISIPNSFESNLKHHFKRFAYYEADEDFEWMLDGSLSQLISLGYLEIDCLLYEAGMKLNYSEVEHLLELGANPDIHISGDFSPAEIEKVDINDTYCLRVDVNTRLSDAIDLDGIYTYWENGVRNETQSIGTNDIYSFFQGAAYRLMELLISEKNGKSNSNISLTS